MNEYYRTASEYDDAHVPLIGIQVRDDYDDDPSSPGRSAVTISRHGFAVRREACVRVPPGYQVDYEL